MSLLYWFEIMFMWFVSLRGVYVVVGWLLASVNWISSLNLIHHHRMLFAS